MDILGVNYLQDNVERFLTCIFNDIGDLRSLV